MIIEVKMPHLGLTMEEGTIIEWTAQVGDKVDIDDTILVVETDKAATDVPSPGSGILAKIVAKAGETVPVDEVIAYLAETQVDLDSVPSGDRSATGEAAPATATPPVAAPVPSVAATPPPTPAGTAAMAPVTHPSVPTPGQRVFASPRARAKARALGIELATIPCAGERIMELDVVRAAAAGPQTGPGARFTPLAARLAAELGIDLAVLAASPEARVRAADLLLAMTLTPQAATAAPSDRQAAPLEATPIPEAKALGRVRRITAERMTLSWQTAPQPTFHMRCDMTKAVQFRSELKAEAEARGIKLSYDAMFVRAVATALMDFPEANSQWVEGEGIRTYPQAHVGVAVDLGESGLIVPVIRSADSRGLFSIAAEVGRLVGLARKGKLAPDDYKGGTFTISNLGLLDIETFTPVINLPEAAILGIGTITPTPVYQDGTLVERCVATLALTTDHRVLDGAPSARFLRRVRTLMEQPLLLLENGL